MSQAVTLPPTYGAAPVAPVPGAGAVPAPGAGTAVTPSAGTYGFPAPQMTIPPVTPPPGASLGSIQPFDPYAMPPLGSVPPTTYGAPVPQSTLPSVPVLPPATPTWPAPGITTGAPPATTLPPVGSGPPMPPFQKLFQDTGFRYMWQTGEAGYELQIHEFDISTTMYFPKFLGSGPLRVKPGFLLDALNGPSPPAESDMPSRLYAPYLDFHWTPGKGRQMYGDLNFRTGVYSDFESVTNDSVRFMGTGVGVIALNPTTSLKIGITYLDRVDAKILPAVGVLWEPNDQTRWDIFFPAPRLSSYWRTWNNRQLWWYLGGEYGTGSWTIDRQGEPLKGASDRVDINDIRVFLGIEWKNLNRFNGFIDIGYVFNRELVYVVVPEDSIKLDNTIMLRSGLSF